MDLESAESSEIEALSEALERLKIPTFNMKMEENPMVDATVITRDLRESSTTERFRPRHSRTPTAR